MLVPQGVSTGFRDVIGLTNSFLRQSQQRHSCSEAPCVSRNVRSHPLLVDLYFSKHYQGILASQVTPQQYNPDAAKEPSLAHNQFVERISGLLGTVMAKILKEVQPLLSLL